MNHKPLFLLIFLLLVLTACGENGNPLEGLRGEPDPVIVGTPAPETVEDADARLEGLATAVLPESEVTATETPVPPPPIGGGTPEPTAVIVVVTATPEPPAPTVEEEDVEEEDEEQ